MLLRIITISYYSGNNPGFFSWITSIHLPRYCSKRMESHILLLWNDPAARGVILIQCQPNTKRTGDYTSITKHIFFLPCQGRVICYLTVTNCNYAQLNLCSCQPVPGVQVTHALHTHTEFASLAAQHTQNSKRSAFTPDRLGKNVTGLSEIIFFFL